MQVSNTAVAALSDERQLKQIAKRYAADYPDPHDLARSAAQSILFRHTGKHLDPDHVYWHRFTTASSSELSFTGWKHAGTPVQSMTMIELLIHRFEVSDQSSADELALYGGFYTDGPSHEFFDERNEVRLLPEEVLRDFWALDFSAGYRRKMDRFWTRHSDNCCLLAKASYLARAGESVARRHLSLADFQTVRSVISQDPMPRLEQLRTAAPASPGVLVFPLELGAFKARDILRIVGPGARQILYLGGEARPFRSFDTHQHLYQWLKGQFLSLRTRASICARFLRSSNDWQTHRDAFQRDVAQLLSRAQDLEGTDRLVNRTGEPIAGDPFVYLREVARSDMANDADALLTSNADLRKQIWLGYLNTFLSVFGNLAPLGWPMALAVVGASAANVGLSIDQAVNARTSAQRSLGVQSAISSAIYLFFNLPFLLRTGAGVNTAWPRVSPPPGELPGNPLSGMPGDIVLESQLPAAQDGRFQGTYPLGDGETWVTVGREAHRVSFDEHLGSWVIVDADNPFAFNGRCPVVLSADGYWQRLSAPGLAGGMPMDSVAAGASAQPRFTPVQSVFWDRFMQLNLFDEKLYSEAAVARQESVVEVYRMEPQEVVTSDSDGEDVHFDEWGARHRVYRTAEGEYFASNITAYTHDDEAYNQFLRTGVPKYPDQVAMLSRFVEDVITVGSNNDVALYRGGSGARGTSGAFFRTGDVQAGDVLVNTDIISFSENPYMARTFASSQGGMHASATEEPIRFDDTSVVFVLPEKSYLGAAPIAPFSASPEEAEAVFLPGHYFQIDSIEHVLGTFYQFMKVQLREIGGPLEGRKLLDLRTGEAFSREQYAVRLGSDAKALTDFFFPLSTS